jgi:TfoX/Sxy family transcriptional regulator of competence genes
MDAKDFIEKLEKTLQDAILEVQPETILTYKHMFGGAGYYADGQIFAAWFGNDTIALKLSDEDGEELLQIDGAKKGMMGQYVEIPSAWLENPDELTGWVEKSLKHVASLPKKKKK